MITPTVFKFLKDLKKNNTREWMLANKKTYLENEKVLKSFYKKIETALNKTDVISKTKIFRINRDLRFSKNKTPYNVHRSVSFARAGVARRGGYYLRIEPGNTLIAGGFFAPEPADLFRIRKEFEMDSHSINAILNNPTFKKVFGFFNTENTVKVAPKGFDKNHPNIHLIKLKSYYVTHKFTDVEALAPDFLENVMFHFNLLRPYFDYMSEVLTTNLNGESILD